MAELSDINLSDVIVTKFEEAIKRKETERVKVCRYVLSCTVQVNLLCS